MIKCVKKNKVVKCPSCKAGSTLVLEENGLEYCLACHSYFTDPSKSLSPNEQSCHA